MELICGKYVCDFLVADSVRDVKAEQRAYEYYGCLPPNPMLLPLSRKFTLELPVTLNESLDFGKMGVEKLSETLVARVSPLFPDREKEAIMLTAFRYEPFEKEVS